MKKIVVIISYLLTFTGLSIFASEHGNELDSQVDNRFIFESDDFDPTTAFIDIEDGMAENRMGVDALDVIEYAKTYLGRPYRYGSKGPKAFDCSGFTSYVFRNFDISLSPSSSTQSTQGEAVSKSDIQPGDLLFFKGRRSGGVGHVGLVVDVDANGEISFIHAATSKGIRIDKLNSDPYYSSRYICARRVLD